MFYVAAVLTISVGLVLCGGPSRDRLAGCRDVPAWRPVLRQSVSRAGRRRVGCVLGRIRQRAPDAPGRKPANFGDDAVMPLICPTRQTARSYCGAGFTG